jgi:predicted nucleotidyltransferase
MSDGPAFANGAALTEASVELRALAQRVADALPDEIVEEVILTGSVSRGSADEISDIEMLVVSHDRLDLDTCFAFSSAAGLDDLDTWGAQDTPTRKVSGSRDGVPLELIWQARADAEASIDAIFDGDPSSAADAIANGVALRTAGLLARWQARLRVYPDDLVSKRVERAASTWGGFAPAGILTIARPGERLAMIERVVDDANRVLTIVYAINRVWQPTNKRLASRTAVLALKPDRLPERITTALTEPDPLRALLTMTALQSDTVALAPEGPNVLRARRWLAAVADELSAAMRHYQGERTSCRGWAQSRRR